MGLLNRSNKLKDIIIQIKGQVEDDVSITEIENKIYDSDILDFYENVTVEEQ